MILDFFSIVPVGVEKMKTWQSLLQFIHEPDQAEAFVWRISRIQRQREPVTDIIS